jgi:uncharacterized protein (TIGR02145 family)
MKNLFTLSVKKLSKAIAFLTVAFSLFFMVGCSDAPTVETVSASSIDGGSSIHVSGKIFSDGGQAVQEKGFCLSRHAVPTIADSRKTVSPHSESYAAVFSGLEKNVIYYVRAYAQNSIGIGYGEVIEVYTSALAFAQTGSAEVLSNTEATIRGSVDALNSQVETWFEVWRNGEPIHRVDIQKTGAQSATEIFATATGLTPGKVYSYAVKAKNDAGITTGETKTFRLYYEQVSDYDGNKYWTVKIGDQIWLAENLKTTHFLNGEPIPNIQPDNEWVAMKSPAWCYTKNDPVLGSIYGCLYNNHVGLDSRGLIEGYRTPGIQDFDILVSYNGGGTIANPKLKSATDDWYDGRKGNNSSGFNALPGGWRSWKENPFSALYYQAVFLTTTRMEGIGAYYDIMIYGSGNTATFYASDMYIGRSIRLIKN